MFLLNDSMKAKPSVVAGVGAAGLALMLVACGAVEPAVTDSQADAGTPVSADTLTPERIERACAALVDLVSQHDEGFEELRGADQTSRFADVWQAEPIFGSGNCEIRGWADGKIIYACVWPQSGESEARSNYERNGSRVTDCLGESWEKTGRPMKTGSVTRFRSPTATADVYVLYYSERGGGSRGWVTSLIVGDDPALTP
jgi:hypothetical protein